MVLLPPPCCGCCCGALPAHAPRLPLPRSTTLRTNRPQVPSSPDELAEARRRLAARYPLADFAAARRRLDPKNILGSPALDALLPPAGDA